MKIIHFIILILVITLLFGCNSSSTKTEELETTDTLSQAETKNLDTTAMADTALGMAFAFVGVQLAVFGVYMGASFAPNHKGMPVIAHDAKLDFFTKQVRTSRNIRGGWWATALMGGLNYQVEHHLFPSMPRPFLAKARVIVRERCEQLEVPYTETSLLRSYAIVIEYLNRVGLAARDPFDCPIAAQYGRR